MIINQIGAQIQYQDTLYTCGDAVIATPCSVYTGLFGVITEIHIQDSQIPAKKPPEFCCQFYPPFDPLAIEELESRFTCLCSSPKKLKDIPLDYVIMAPEMIRVLLPQNSTHIVTAYRIEEKYAFNDGEEYGMEVMFELDETQAILRLTELVTQAKNLSPIKEWLQSPYFESIITPLYFECWLEDGYSEYGKNHYRASICSQQISISSALFEQLKENQ